MIKLFVNEYNKEYSEQELSYLAGYIDKDWIIVNAQMWAIATFAIGMPIYDIVWNELGKLSIWLFRNLDYGVDSPIKIPVEFREVKWYSWPLQKIKTYYQNKLSDGACVYLQNCVQLHKIQWADSKHH